MSPDAKKLEKALNIAIEALMIYGEPCNYHDGTVSDDLGKVPDFPKPMPGQIARDAFVAMDKVLVGIKKIL